VFVKIVRVDYGVQNSGAYLLLGIVLWSFFAELTGGSVASVVAKGDLLRKINFPKYVIVVAIAASALINLFLNMLIVVLFMFIGGIDLNLDMLYTPLLLFELFVFSFAVGLFLSATYVHLRDIGYIWDVVMQALFYLTPILFPLTFAPLWLQKILILNPLAQIIQDLRYVLISKDTATVDTVFANGLAARFSSILLVAVVFIGSAAYFKLKSKTFAEDI
jgi:ABC-2 type transport system permease protein